MTASRDSFEKAVGQAGWDFDEMIDTLLTYIERQDDQAAFDAYMREAAEGTPPLVEDLSAAGSSAPVPVEAAIAYMARNAPKDEIEGEPVLPEDWQTECETESFDVTKVWHCWGHICESSFGFSVTHPSYNEKTWLDPIIEKTKSYHGDAAYKLLDAAVMYTGHAGHAYHNEDLVVAGLLKCAIVESEYHRGVRKSHHG